VFRDVTMPWRVFHLFCLLPLLAACVAKEQPDPARIRTTVPAHEAYVAGEYVITATGTDVDSNAIRNVYAAFGVETLQSLGRGRFLIRLTRDPGLDRVRSVGRESGQVQAAQPNYIYRKQ
jgi:hypothetical protein